MLEPANSAMPIAIVPISKETIFRLKRLSNQTPYTEKRLSLASVRPETWKFGAAAFKKMMISQKVGKENSCPLQEEEK